MSGFESSGAARFGRRPLERRVLGANVKYLDSNASRPSSPTDSMNIVRSPHTPQQKLEPEPTRMQAGETKERQVVHRGTEERGGGSASFGSVRWRGVTVPDRGTWMAWRHDAVDGSTDVVRCSILTGSRYQSGGGVDADYVMYLAWQRARDLIYMDLSDV